MMTDVSPAVVILVVIAAAACVYSFVCDRRAQRVATQILTHVTRRRPDALDTIPWFWRRFAKPTIKLGFLRRAIPAALPPQELTELRRLERHAVVSVIVGLGVLMTLLIASHVFGLSWGTTRRR